MAQIPLDKLLEDLHQDVENQKYRAYHGIDYELPEDERDPRIIELERKLQGGSYKDKMKNQKELDDLKDELDAIEKELEYWNAIKQTREKRWKK